MKKLFGIFRKRESEILQLKKQILQLQLDQMELVIQNIQLKNHIASMGGIRPAVTAAKAVEH